MTTFDAPVEHTTRLALDEKAKLKKSLRRFDMIFFTLCAFVGLDTLGLVAASGPQGFTWLILLAVLFVVPYGLVLSEVGSAFTEEGGPYEWVKLSFGRLARGRRRGAVLGDEPALGGWFARVHCCAPGVGHDVPADSRRQRPRFVRATTSSSSCSSGFRSALRSSRSPAGKWIPTAGGFARIFVLGFFTLTVDDLRDRERRRGLRVRRSLPFDGRVPRLWCRTCSSTTSVSSCRTVRPKRWSTHTRDVPHLRRKRRRRWESSCTRSRCSASCSFFRPRRSPGSVVSSTPSRRRSPSTAARQDVPLCGITALGFIFTLLTSGAVWMIGSDRIQAVAAYDGGFFSYFGVFNREARNAGARQCPLGDHVDGVHGHRGADAEERERGRCVQRRTHDCHLDHAHLVSMDLPCGDQAAICVPRRSPALRRSRAARPDYGLLPY